MNFMLVLKDGKTNMDCGCVYRICQPIQRCLLTAFDQIARNEGSIRPVKELKTLLTVIPGGLTGQLQLGLAINKTFEALMREKWMKWTDELWVTHPGR